MNPGHAELVSVSMPHCLCETGERQLVTEIEAWVLKQVQDDDGVAGFAQSHTSPAC
jgi:hypothetical protein